MVSNCRTSIFLCLSWLILPMAPASAQNAKSGDSLVWFNLGNADQASNIAIWMHGRHFRYLKNVTLNAQGTDRWHIYAGNIYFKAPVRKESFVRKTSFDFEITFTSNDDFKSTHRLTITRSGFLDFVGGLDDANFENPTSDRGLRRYSIPFQAPHQEFRCKPGGLGAKLKDTSTKGTIVKELFTVEYALEDCQGRAPKVSGAGLVLTALGFGGKDWRRDFLRILKNKSEDLGTQTVLLSTRSNYD